MFHKKVKLKENRDDVLLTTYLLDDSPELLDGKKRPVVIICPGGAYLNCSDREAEPVAIKFNAMGYHAVVLRYSVLNKPNIPFSTSDEELKKIEFSKDNLHPEPIRDIARSIIWLDENSNDYFIDMSKVVLCGFSAGAHNVLNYSTYWHKDEITGYFNKPMDLFKPLATIACYPLTDYVYMDKHARASENPLDIGLFDLANRSFLGKTDPCEAELIAISPAKQVSPMTPPIFLWATAEDGLVPAYHSILMAAGLAEEGIPYELHIYENGSHGLSLADTTTAQALTQVRPDVAPWIMAAKRWLSKRCTFDLPAKTMWDE